jgi:hypothetical protein
MAARSGDQKKVTELQNKVTELQTSLDEAESENLRLE